MTPHTRCQLTTYPGSLGGDLAALDRLLRTKLCGLFPGGVHVLPPFPSSADRGFAPLTYEEIDPRFGGWGDIERLAQHGGLMVDLMVNHISRQSPEFQDFVAHGRSSKWSDLFVTVEKIWPDGGPTAADIEAIFLRKPEHPFTDVRIAASGECERIWTTFGSAVDTSEQVDLDIRSPLAWQLYQSWFATLAAHGVTTVRLDAVGYVTKKAGTSCFMVEPEIWSFLNDVSALAASLGLEVVPEVHDRRPTFEAITARGHSTYNFVLPAVILEAVLSRDGEILRQELRACPPNQLTMLDCHDGIPIQPDLSGVLPESRMRALVDTLVARGANVNKIINAPPGSFDAHQVNITYPDACGTADAYLAARAVQLFAPGTPQIYYVGLLGGTADHAAVERTGDGRAVNRHDYSEHEIVEALGQDMVQRQIELIELRNSHPAFAGSCRVPDSGENTVVIEWTNGSSSCRLEVDLRDHRVVIETG